MSSQTIFVTKASTDATVDVGPILQDAGATSPGDPLTALVYNSAGLVCYFREGATGTVTQLTLATQTVGGAHSDGGFVELDATNMPGMYRLDLSDTIVSGTNDRAILTLAGNADMATHTVHIVLTDMDLYDAVRGGMTSLPDANADAAGGLPISDLGGLDLDTLDSNVSDILTDTGTSGVLISAGTGTGQVSLASGLVRLSAAGVDDIWDEATSGHVSEGSFGQHFFPAQVGTATAGAATTITLDATGRSAVDDFYNGSLIRITGGTGAGQSRFVTDYDQASGVATVGAWATNPSTDSDYVITLFDTIVGATAPTADQNAAAVWDKAMSSHTSEGSFGSMIQSFQEGQTQAGSTSSTIVLDATGASATEDFYKYAVVEVLTGTAIGQSRQITAYAQASTTATVDPAWTTTPGTGDQYVIRGLGIDAATLANIADAVWDQPRADNIQAGSRGEYVFSDAIRISGSAAAADGLEAATTGATPLPANTTQWLGSAVAAVTQAGVPEVDVTFVAGVAEDLPTATNMQTIDDNVDSILTDTGTTLPAQIGTPVLTDISADIAANLTAVQALNDLSVADILTTAMTESYAAEGVAPTLAQALFWLYQLPSDAYRVGTTMTVRNLAGGDAGTITLDDGANPTDINRAT